MRNHNVCQPPHENYSTLTIDPALHGIGFGLWYGAELYTGGYLPRPKGTPSRGPGAWHALGSALADWFQGQRPNAVVVEQMKLYQRGHGKHIAKPDDLFELSGVAGACCALATDRAYGYIAAEWKGQVPADVMARRIRETRLVDKGWVDRVHWLGTKRDEDIAHGIGLGLFHFGL